MNGKNVEVSRSSLHHNRFIYIYSTTPARFDTTLTECIMMPKKKDEKKCIIFFMSNFPSFFFCSLLDRYLCVNIFYIVCCLTPPKRFP
jgi:hypothetical protein